MARSLTVNHQEKLATSPLFNLFLLVAFGWMMAGAVVANWSASADLAVGTVAAE